MEGQLQAPPAGSVGSSEFNASSAAVESLTQQLQEDASAVENADVRRDQNNGLSSAPSSSRAAAFAQVDLPEEVNGLQVPLRPLTRIRGAKPSWPPARAPLATPTMRWQEVETDRVLDKTPSTDPLFAVNTHHPAAPQRHSAASALLPSLLGRLPGDMQQLR